MVMSFLLPLSYFHLFLGEEIFFLFYFSLTEVTPVEFNGPCIVFQSRSSAKCFDVLAQSGRSVAVGLGRI